MKIKGRTLKKNVRPNYLKLYIFIKYVSQMEGMPWDLSSHRAIIP